MKVELLETNKHKTEEVNLLKVQIDQITEECQKTEARLRCRV